MEVSIFDYIIYFQGQRSTRNLLNVLCEVKGVLVVYPSFVESFLLPHMERCLKRQGCGRSVSLIG